MSNLGLLVICFCLGIFFKKFSRLPETASQVLNGFILNVSLPALVLYHIHEIKISRDVLLPALMPWIIFFIAGILFHILYWLKKIEFKTSICLTLTAGLGNTSFVGIPLLESYLGKESIGYGIVVDQLGTFLVLSFPGLILLSVAENGNWRIGPLFLRVVSFVPAQALFLALLLRPISYPDWVIIILQRLGDTLSPLALVSVGFLLNLRTLKGHKKSLLLGLSVKLMIFPILIIFIYKQFSLDRLMFETIVLESAMAPMVTSTIILIEKNMSPHLAALMLGIGIPISFLTTFLLSNLLKVGFV